ncbi:MAG: threonine synthase [Synergistaceae bacterium]|nr:threonine synthase [Synergistaceae bacterium]
MTEHVLKCALCGRERSGEGGPKTCPDCGIDGTMHVLWDYDAARARLTREALAKDPRASLWRYEALLPVDEGSRRPTLQVGWTPFYSFPALASELGVREVLIKDDGREPTASLKDRASCVAVTMAAARGREVISCASTGNAASSLAGLAANMGLRSVIFVPQTAPVAKVTQLLVFGARVFLVKGDYAATVRLAMEAIERHGWYDRNCAIDPYLVEGKKTCAMEIAEQCEWDVPDRVFVSVGDGCIVSSTWKGFHDLYKVGLIDRVPKIVGVQAEGACPIHRAFQAGDARVVFGPSHTVADSIDVGAPHNWAKALNALRTSGGDTVAVSDREILDAVAELPRRTGVFAEPAGAAAWAGLVKMAREGRLRSDERVAVIVSGNGLKDVASAQRAVRPGEVVGPDMEELERLLSRS